ncbi:MAG: FG-GAP-like repeat-containing protein, partial [Rhodanobacteraceae bacterium]
MSTPRFRYRFRNALCFGVLLAAPLAHAISVSSTTPVGNANNVARNGAITIEFDTPLDTASITASSFRVWGAQTGRIAGTTQFSNGDRTLTFTPSGTYFPGDWISIQLAHSIEGADSSSLRAAGYAFQFQARAGVGAMSSTEIDVVSVSLEGETTRLYGGAITDLNRDGWIDYIGVNEISHDLRVLLNTADGSGLLGPILEPPTPIGAEASPSTVSDFNNDGLMDVATGNSQSSTASIALGSGDGHFSSVQSRDVGARPHGIVALDVDGDADLDLVVASENGQSLTLLINDGAGVFDEGTEFANSDGDGKYALGAGDMNGDGILDLVVGTTESRILVLTGNGNGTFTESEDIGSGGYGWKLVLGDVDDDGNLDVAQANGGNASGSILLGNGNGTLAAPAIYSFQGTTVGSALGDLDGDGDLDWVVSSYGAGEWYVLENNGDGSFTRVDTIP